MSEEGDELSTRGNPEKFRRVVDGQPFRLPTGPGGIQRPQVSRAEQDQIGLTLRGMYDGLLSEPVPEHFVNLIRRLQ